MANRHGECCPITGQPTGKLQATPHVLVYELLPLLPARGVIKNVQHSGGAGMCHDHLLCTDSELITCLITSLIKIPVQ